MKKTRRISSLLCAAMLFSLCAQPSKALLDELTSVSSGVMQRSRTGISPVGGDMPVGRIQGSQAHNVYFGVYNGNPAKWRVLANNSDALFLFADTSFFNMQWRPADHPKSQDIVWGDLGFSTTDDTNRGIRARLNNPTQFLDAFP